MGITKEELIPCFDINHIPNNQYISKSGVLYDEDLNEIKPYVSTNGFKYVPYNINVDEHKYTLIRLDFVILMVFSNIMNFKEYDPIHIDCDNNNYSVDNITYCCRVERWKDIDIPEMKGIYQISNNGRLRNVVKDEIVKGSIFKNGYRHVSLTDKKFTIHRLVGMTHVINPDKSKYNIINHIDDDRLNNFDWNLEWCDQKRNSVHGAIYGNMGSLEVSEIDLIRDMLMDPKYSGSAKKIYDALHDTHPNITRSKIYAIKQNRAYLYTERHNINDIKFQKYAQDIIPTDTIDLVRDMLMQYHFSPSKVYKNLDKNKFPNISIMTIKDIKCCHRSYMRSNKYDLNQISKLFQNHKDPRKGSVKRMEGINNNPNNVLDLCRKLLMTKTFHGSPRTLFNNINHDKYPNITENIIKHITYDDVESSAYYRTDCLDLSEFFKKIKNKDFSAPDKDLIDLLIKSYSEGSSDISDESYDVLLEEYLKEHGESARPFLRVTKSNTVNDFQATLSKTYGVTSAMREGQLTYEQWFNRKGFTGDEKIVIQAKFDGCSVAYDVNEKRYFTRGDYDNGESVDVTELFEQYHDPEHDVVSDFDWTKYDGVKFEAILCKQMYNGTFDSIYKRPRDVVAATITSRNVDNALCISLIPLRVIDKDGVHRLADTYPEYSKTTTSGDFEGIQTFIDGILDDGATFTLDRIGITFDIDGVVVSVLNEDDDIIDEIAIKILNNIQETRIINIEYQYGKTGKITPVGILEPVKFDNVTVDHVGLSTLDRVVSLDLKYNDTVRVVYNIVPYLLSSYHDGTYPIPIPKKCPICGAELNFKTLKTVRCTNPHCSGLKIGYINRYCEKMKMMGISKGIITKLFDAGLLNNISDLYKLRIENIMCVEGFKEKSAKNIIDSIRSSSENVSIAKWLGALPIKDVSAKTWQLVIDAKFGKDEMLASNVIRCTIETGNPDTFMSECVPDYVYGFSVNTYAAIKEGIALYWDDIRETIKGVSFNCLTDVKKIPTKGRVTLTGFRDSELISLLTLRGYDVNDFSSKTMALVIPYSGYVSSKVSKANRMGIPIYLPEEAKEALK